MEHNRESGGWHFQRWLMHWFNQVRTLDQPLCAALGFPFQVPEGGCSAQHQVLAWQHRSRKKEEGGGFFLLRLSPYIREDYPIREDGHHSWQCFPSGVI